LASKYFVKLLTSCDYSSNMMQLYCVLFLCLVVPYAAGKCAEIGGPCSYAEWTKTIKPIRDAFNSGQSGSLRPLLEVLMEKLKNIERYDEKICYVYYDDTSMAVYNYGYDCGPNNKCQCGSQLVGSPVKKFELEWDTVSKGCRRKTGEVCSKYGFIPEHQNCLNGDICAGGICTKIENVQGPIKKMQNYPKAGDPCKRSIWESLYKPYLDARDETHSLEGQDTEESQAAEEKSIDLFNKLMNTMEEMPERYGDVCYTTDNVLLCDEDNKCACNSPYFPDPNTQACRTATGDTCFKRCIHLPEDQCLSTDHCFTYDIYKGLATCYPEGVYPEKKKKGRKIEKESKSASNKLSFLDASIKNYGLSIVIDVIFALFWKIIF